jgi:mannose/cellobiose epimerase-like protein (N-acyl-D-glucosamine 2-epimerase family)
MALTYQQVYQQAQDPNWLQRVASAIAEAAVAIAVDAPSAGVNTRRDALARDVLASPIQWAQTMALGIALGFLANNALNDATDAQIAARVSAVWNDYMDVA